MAEMNFRRTLFMTKSIMIFSLALLLALAPLCTYAQDGKGIERTATSTITTRNDKEKGIVVIITNRRFAFSPFYNESEVEEDRFRTLLFLEELRSERSMSMEGQDSYVKTEAWMGKDAKPSQKLWTIEEKGDESEILDRLYKVIKYGCCAAETTFNYFNILTGQKVFTSTGDLFKISVPNTTIQLDRYVAYHSRAASLPPVEAETAQNVIGVIQYGSESKMTNKLVLRSKVENSDDVYTPKIKALYQKKFTDSNELMLWGVDKKNSKSSLSDFTLVFSFYGGSELRIPVVNDSLDFNNAVVPKGFILERGK